MSAIHGKRILALPVDGRPVVREQVRQLVAAAPGWELVLPPVEALGHLRRPADRDALARWLLAEAERGVDGFVLSLDMLVYGGLVPSRFIDDPIETLRPRLSLVEQLRERWPEAPIYAFAATMRISNNDVNEEEKLYWSRHGRQLWRWSFHSDRFDCLAEPADRDEARAAAAAIPPEIRSDYLATRERNFALVRAALQRARDGAIARLILPQDDTAEFGFNIAERRRLQAEVQAESTLRERVRIYPGADEVLHTLCAHLVATQSGRPPLKIAVLAGDPQHVGGLRALYEDRPLLDAVAAQIEACGAGSVSRPEQADVLLALHSQGSEQGDWAMCKPLPQRVPLGPAWLATLAAWQRDGKPLAVADLAYANGGDPQLVHALQGVLPLNGLAAYAGWNTASNSLGSVVAQCVLARDAHQAPANRHNLALRLLEDFVYQALMRQIIRTGHDAVVRAGGFDAEGLRALVAELFIPQANAWARAHALGFEVESIALPWDRSFEIDIRLRPCTR